MISVLICLQNLTTKYGDNSFSFRFTLSRTEFVERAPVCLYYNSSLLLFFVYKWSGSNVWVFLWPGAAFNLTAGKIN